MTSRHSATELRHASHTRGRNIDGHTPVKTMIMASWGWIGLGMLSACLVASGVAHSAASRPEKGFQLDIGALTIVAKRDRISAPGFPDSTMNPFRKMDIHRFSLRHEGRPVSLSLPGRPGDAISSFNMVYVLKDAPRPALLVPSGMGVHLVEHGDHGLQVRALPAMDRPVAQLQWLDAAAGQPVAEQSPRLAEHAPASLTLQGGRWLLVNRSVVLDVRTLQYHAVRPWIPQGSDQPMAGLNASTEPALALSPQGSQYAALASGAGTGDGWDRALLVVDMPTGNPYGVPIPLQHRADVDAGLVDGAWILRHFAWRNRSGVEQLVHIDDVQAPHTPGI